MPASRSEVRGDTGARGAVDAGRTRIALDFETFYDTDYTLRKLSTSEYVRDSRFEAISVAVKLGDGPTVVYFGPEIGPALRGLDWRRAELLCHHAHFDGLILSHHYGIRPAYYLDTLSMGRALHPKFERNSLEVLAVKYGVQNKLPMPDFKGKRAGDFADDARAELARYNAADVDSMCQLYDKLRPQMPPAEMDLIDITVRMFADPVLLLNQSLAKRELAREIKEREELIGKSSALKLVTAMGLKVKPKKKGEPITDEQVLSSNKIFPELLRGLGVEPPRKISKTTGEETYALAKADEEFTDLVAHPDPRVVAAVRGRLAAKSTIGETRAARLLRSGSQGKALPVYLNYCGAHTTRWSGGDKLNYQNLKKKGDIRKAIKAPPGHQLVVIDSKTIEVRVLAWLAGESWLLEAFRNGADPYLIFGRDIYGREITAKDKLERFVSKTCVLGLGFQMGGPKLQLSVLVGSINQGLDPVRLELPVSYNLVNTYRGKNRKIVELWNFHNDEVIFELAFGKRGTRKTYRGVIDYGREFVQLRDHLALHYPECQADVSKAKPASGYSRSKQADKTKVSDASYRTPAGRTKMYGGMLTENIVQYLARQVVAYQMLEIAKRYRIVMMTHDEVVFLAPTKEAKRALAWGMEVMRKSPPWAPDLPLDAEGGYDSVYSK